MFIDLDLIFDDLIGYAFYHKTEVSAVIGDKIKCADGEVVEFFDNVEYSIDDFDEIVIFEKKETVAELEEFLKFLVENNNNDLVKTVKGKIEEANRSGIYRSYIALCNDEIYHIYDFSL